MKRKLRKGRRSTLPCPRRCGGRAAALLSAGGANIPGPAASVRCWPQARPHESTGCPGKMWWKVGLQPELWCLATSTGLEVLNAGAVMDSLEEKYLEAEDKLNMEARPGPQFLTSTGFLRKCPLGLGEISAGLACAGFHLTGVMGREAFSALNLFKMLHFMIGNKVQKRVSRKDLAGMQPMGL